MRPIDADLLIEHCMNGIDNEFIPMVEEMPTLDVKPTVNGEWIERKFPTQTYFVCSKCGKPMYQMDKNFCAHCGADMREEQE